MVGRMEALKSANLEGDLGEDGAEMACSSGIRFRADTGADAGCCGGGVTGATLSGSAVGFVRHRSAGADGLPPPMPEKKASFRGVAGAPAAVAVVPAHRRAQRPPPTRPHLPRRRPVVSPAAGWLVGWLKVSAERESNGSVRLDLQKGCG